MPPEISSVVPQGVLLGISPRIFAEMLPGNPPGVPKNFLLRSFQKLQNNPLPILPEISLDIPPGILDGVSLKISLKIPPAIRPRISLEIPTAESR